MSRVLVISRDRVGRYMAAPGIRCAEIARELAIAGNEVLLSIPNESDLRIAGVRQVTNRRWIPREQISNSDVVLLGGAGHWIMPVPRLPLHIPLVVDLSSPLMLEVLAVGRGDRAEWPPPVPLGDLIVRLRRYFLRADLLLCANKEQWDFYVGCLTALRRVGDKTLQLDPGLRRLLALVPFGCPPDPPRPRRSGPRSGIPGIGADDYVLLWSGVLANWYDPELIVRAVAAAARQVPNVRLVFLGTRPAMSGRADTHASQRARQIASEFGLLNRHVFFVDEWVPYEDRGDWLLEADAAVIAAPPTLEAHFSVRIRSNDCIWAGTPIICTRGQPLADVVEQNQVGFVVEPHDVGGMREAIVMLADGDVRARMRERLARMRPEFSWTKVLQPLIAFCADPQPAGDRDPKTLSLTSRARLLTVMGLDNARLLVRRIACGFSFSG